MTTTKTQFNELTLTALAFKAGETFSKSQNQIGQKFMGGFNVADAIGFNRNTPEWDAAVSGAMLHIKTLDVITNQNDTLVE